MSVTMCPEICLLSKLIFLHDLVFNPYTFIFVKIFILDSRFLPVMFQTVFAALILTKTFLILLFFLIFFIIDWLNSGVFSMKLSVKLF